MSKLHSHRQYSAAQFQLHEELGRGAFGVVYRAYDTIARMDVAIKQIDLETNEEINEIQKEIRMLATCHDFHVTKYYGCFLKGFKLWIIMEYLGGGSCSELLIAGPFSEPVIGYIMHEILLALKYLHETGKIHRDIKAANVLMSKDGDIKIADFGVATQLSNNLSKRNTFVGTPYWMPPEIVKHRDYTFTADIWSLGITAIELAYGKPPLSEYHPFDVLFKIPDDPPPTLGSGFSEEFNDFVNQCLNKDPLKRPKAVHLLKHKFIKKYAKVDKSKLIALVEKKAKWDSEMGGSDKKMYIPTAVSTNSDEEDDSNGKPGAKAGGSEIFDLGTLTLENEKDQKTITKVVPPSVPKVDANTLSPDEQKVRKDFNSILNQSFNKISNRYNLSTSQYDRLVNYQTLLMDSFIMDSDEEFKDIFGKFSKLISKKVMKSNNQNLKDKLLPRYYLGMEKELKELKEKEKKQIGDQSRDDVEELLLTRWAEGIIERWHAPEDNDKA
ncbi:unnamed protein product [Ambrosiozyma monospora]|uniref:non-specific serine/threonine protein kinase n=1 Tax=Ambrosiozyma monospora TaxID=43982 RepID=A0A9W6Z1S9_AMBMO|nr:unnamed protein product [Ambrosiozyma monospora]